MYRIEILKQSKTGVTSEFVLRYTNKLLFLQNIGCEEKQENKLTVHN